MLRRRRSLLDLDDAAVDMRKPLIATSLMSFYTSTLAIAQLLYTLRKTPWAVQLVSIRVITTKLQGERY